MNRIGKQKALDLLFKTEEIEANGGELTALGDRRYDSERDSRCHNASFRLPAACCKQIVPD